MREILLPILLGLVQGITEFLPISSDGHLALVHNLFNYKRADLFFDVMLHLATLLVVLQFLGKDFFAMLRDCRHGSDEIKPQARHLLSMVLVASIPAAIFGLTAKHEIEAWGGRPVLVGMLIIVNGLFLLLPKFIRITHDWPLLRFTKVRALFVGVAQAAAILPGVSRSGLTITSAQLLQLQPLEAFRFSFYLFIPAVSGAVVLELLDLLRGKVVMDWQPMLLGFLSAYISGVFALKLLTRILSGGKFYRFGYYCLALGTISCIYFMLQA